MVEALFYRAVLKSLSQITRPLQPVHFNIICEETGSRHIVVPLHTRGSWLLRGKMSVRVKRTELSQRVLGTFRGRIVSSVWLVNRIFLDLMFFLTVHHELTIY